MNTHRTPNITSPQPPDLLTPAEVDALLRYRAGRSARLARGGKLPHVLLPDGSIRFRYADIERITTPPATGGFPALRLAGREGVAHAR